MGVFKELDPEVALRAIEGYQDELLVEKEEQDSLHKRYHCPRCRCDLNAEYNAATAFTSGALIPKALLRCPSCRFLIDPHTNLVVESGDASKIPVETIPIIGGDYLPK